MNQVLEQKLLDTECPFTWQISESDPDKVLRTLNNKALAPELKFTTLIISAYNEALNAEYHNADKKIEVVEEVIDKLTSKTQKEVARHILDATKAYLLLKKGYSKEVEEILENIKDIKDEIYLDSLKEFKAFASIYTSTNMESIISKHSVEHSEEVKVILEDIDLIPLKKLKAPACLNTSMYIESRISELTIEHSEEAGIILEDIKDIKDKILLSSQKEFEASDCISTSTNIESKISKFSEEFETELGNIKDIKGEVDLNLQEEYEAPALTNILTDVKSEISKHLKNIKTRLEDIDNIRDEIRLESQKEFEASACISTPTNIESKISKCSEKFEAVLGNIKDIKGKVDLNPQEEYEASALTDILTDIKSKISKQMKRFKTRLEDFDNLRDEICLESQKEFAASTCSNTSTNIESKILEHSEEVGVVLDEIKDIKCKVDFNSQEESQNVSAPTDTSRNTENIISEISVEPDSESAAAAALFVLGSAELEQKFLELQCPFTWRLSKSHTDKITHDLTQKDQFLPVITFVRVSLLLYIKIVNVEYDKVDEYFSEAEQAVGEITSTIKKEVAKHIVDAIKVHYMIKKRDFDKAKEILKNIKSLKEEHYLSPVNEFICALWSHINYNRTVLNIAIDFAKFALIQDPNCAIVHYIMARNLRSLRRIISSFNQPSRDEIDHVTKAFEIEKNPRFGLFVAQIYKEKGLKKHAMKIFKELHKMNLPDISIQLRLALPFIRGNNLQDAKECLDYVESVAPEKSMFLHYKGLYLMKLNMYEKALEYLAKSAEDSNYAADLSYMECARLANKPIDYISYLLNMKEKYSDFEDTKKKEILIYLAITYFLVNQDLKESVDYFLQAFEIKDSCPLKTYRCLSTGKMIDIVKFLRKQIFPKIKGQEEDLPEETVSACKRLKEICNNL